MNKRELSALEKVFAAEIEGRLPFQSTAKVYSALERYGFVVPVHKRLGIATVHGWDLTHAGRYEYCRTCDEDGDSRDG